MSEHHVTSADVDECEANARLIAARQALYERLTAILAAYDANDSRGIAEEIEASRYILSTLS